MTRIKEFAAWFFRTDLIPLFYTISVMLGICSYYTYDQLYLYIPLTVILVTALFRLFDYFGKHKLKGGICIFLVFAAALALVILFEDIGRTLYADRTSGDYFFVVWMLTPKEILTYNPFYAAMAYICYLLFICVTAYYFTRIQYRIIVTAMIAFFPILTFGKDDEMMPLWVGIPMLALYFGVMIYSRQLIRPIPEHSLRIRFSPGKANEKPFWDAQIWKSVLFFLLLGAAVCMAVPKPSITADRAYIDTALNFSGLTDYLMNAISDFTESSDGGGSFNGQGSSRVFAYVSADAPIPLKTRTFSRYSMAEDRWYIGSFDQQFEKGIDWRTECKSSDINDLLDILESVSAADPDFAELYHLTALQSLDDTPLSSSHIEIQPVREITYLLSPTTITKADAPNYARVSRTYTGTLYNSDMSSSTNRYGFTYQTPFYADSDRLNFLLSTSDSRDWNVMLADLYLRATEICSEEEQEVVAHYFTESVNAQQYAFDCGAVNSEQISNLAAELTRDCGSQIERVIALQDYFDNGSFVYDLEYAEPLDANAETFLFESKRGVCYEFATAMTLMCRSVGIPARYVEGYSVNEPTDNRTFDYELRYMDSHAYVEVYLDGFGWCTVDPTIADNSSRSGLFFGRNRIVEFIGIVLILTAALVTGLYLLLWRRVSEAVFRIRIRRMQPSAAISRMMIRLRTQAALSEALTAEEFQQAIMEKYQVDIAALTAQFSVAVYSGQNISEETAAQCYTLYCEARDKIYKEKKREQKECRKRGFKTITPY